MSLVNGCLVLSKGSDKKFVARVHKGEIMWSTWHVCNCALGQHTEAASDAELMRGSTVPTALSSISLIKGMHQGLASAWIFPLGRQGDKQSSGGICKIDRHPPA